MAGHAQILQVMPSDSLAAEDDIATRVRRQLEQRPAQRGLAGATAAHHGDGLAGMHGQVHRIEHLTRAATPPPCLPRARIAHTQVARLDQRFLGLGALRGRPAFGHCAQQFPRVCLLRLGEDLLHAAGFDQHAAVHHEHPLGVA